MSQGSIIFTPKQIASAFFERLDDGMFDVDLLFNSGYMITVRLNAESAERIRQIVLKRSNEQYEFTTTKVNGGCDVSDLGD